MSCTGGMTKDIVSTCATSKGGGLEVIAYIGKRTDLEFTWSSTANKENTITALENAPTKKCVKVTGIKQILDAGHEYAGQDPKRPDKYKHSFSFEAFEGLAEDITNLDLMDDLVVIVELKDKTSTGEGVFRVYGAKMGLYKSSDTQAMNTANGSRIITLASLAGQEEPYSAYVLFVTSYAASKVIFDALANTGS